MRWNKLTRNFPIEFTRKWSGKSISWLLPSRGVQRGYRFRLQSGKPSGNAIKSCFQVHPGVRTHRSALHHQHIQGHSRHNWRSCALLMLVVGRPCFSCFALYRQTNGRTTVRGFLASRILRRRRRSVPRFPTREGERRSVVVVGTQ